MEEGFHNKYSSPSLAVELRLSSTNNTYDLFFSKYTFDIFYSDSTETDSMRLRTGRNKLYSRNRGKTILSDTEVSDL